MALVVKENGVGISSPGCSSNALKSIERASSLGGVPVLRRAILKPSSRKFSASFIDGGSPERPGKSPRADVDQSVQKSARRDDHGFGSEQPAIHQLDADDPTVFGQNSNDLSLSQVKIGNSFKLATHLMAIEGAIGLRPWRLDGGAATAVEHSELDAGLIYHPSHQTSERVDLADQVAFCNSSDGRVARHLGDQVETECDDGSLRAYYGGGVRRFASGVSRSDHHHVELFVKVWHALLSDAEGREYLINDVRDERLSGYDSEAAQRLMQISQGHLLGKACGQILPGLAQCGQRMFQRGVVPLVRDYSIFDTGLSFDGD